MVLIPQSSLLYPYREIKQNASTSNSACTIMILVTPEVDSLCACKILTTLFKTDFITYKIKPILNFFDFKTSLISIVENTENDTNDYKSLIIINSGAIYDIPSIIKPKPENLIKIYIIDYHRPFNKNNELSTYIYLLDGDSSLETINKVSTYDYEEVEEEIENLPINKRLKISENYIYGKTENYDSLDYSKKHKKSQNKLSDVSISISKSGNYTNFLSSSELIYLLSLQLCKSDLLSNGNSYITDIIWYAIVGLSDMYLNGKMPFSVYRDNVFKFEAEINNNNNKSKFKNGGIEFFMDFQFPLYRHWNLYDSMVNSNFLNIKLNLWKKKGVEKIGKILAKIGIPLKMARTNFNFMNFTVKNVLPQNFLLYCQEIKNILIPSFYRYYGYGNDFVLSAFDVVHSVSALFINHPLNNPNNTNNSISNNIPIYDNFWDAYDSLDVTNFCNNFAILKHGIKKAITLQTFIIKVAHLCINKKSLVSSGSFRYVILDEGIISTESSTCSGYVNPLLIMKLGLFLMEAVRSQFQSQNNNSKNNNFVICAPTYINSNSSIANNTDGVKSYIVIGLTLANLKNNFGAAFAQAAKLTNCELLYCNFESSIVIIDKHKLKHFMEVLHIGIINLNNNNSVLIEEEYI